MLLQYPLILPHGNNGYHIHSSVSCMKHYSYMFMVRNQHNLQRRDFSSAYCTQDKRLFQQFIVDVGANRTSTTSIAHQDRIRAELSATLCVTIERV